VKVAFGIIMCLLYELTGSLLPGIAVHSFVDGTAADAAVTGNAYVALGVYGLVLVLVIARRARRTGPIAGDLPESLPQPQHQIHQASTETP
jgi:membrane protease YdiL (CAAX protease family)